jgi:hypothetical protein
VIVLKLAGELDLRGAMLVRGALDALAGPAAEGL